MLQTQRASENCSQTADERSRLKSSISLVYEHLGFLSVVLLTSGFDLGL